jgi:uncharacterized protein YprB with RNaseH-like and TPR domain
MLTKTFCHVPGISITKEHRLWSSGIHSWDAIGQRVELPLPRRAASFLENRIKESFEYLEKREPAYFAELLSANQHWRLFPDFRGSVAYLDIETTGLGYGDSITTIAIYDGKSIRHYVKNVNLNEFKKDIQEYQLIVTYNGKCFDVPFIESHFKIKMNHVHLDLRFILKSLGYAGGLKTCEKRMGIDRKELAEVDGYFAVLLWNDFVRNKNPKALETLLAYNIQDVVNLETLLVKAYNLKIRETPFQADLRLSLPASPELPFEADTKTITRIKRANPWLGR